MADEDEKDPADLGNAEDAKMDDDGVIENKEDSSEIRQKMDADEYTSEGGTGEKFDDLGNVHLGARDLNIEVEGKEDATVAEGDVEAEDETLDKKIEDTEFEDSESVQVKQGEQVIIEEAEASKEFIQSQSGEEEKESKEGEDDGERTTPLAQDGPENDSPIEDDDGGGPTVAATATGAPPVETLEEEDDDDVTIESVADGVKLDVEDASGLEDQAISLDINTSLVDLDGSESLNTSISGIPEGAILSDGTNNFIATGDIHSFDVSNWNLNSLTITPPEHDSSNFSLVITSVGTESEGGAQAGQSQTLNIAVEAIADEADINTANVSGSEDSPIDLSVAVNLVDQDGSEALTTMLQGIPDGAVLKDGEGNTFTAGPGDNSVDISNWDIGSLQVTPPNDSDNDFELTIVATTTEDDNGDFATTTSSFTVDVVGVADAPTVTVAPVQGFEDSAISLDVGASLNDTDGSESLSYNLSGIPDGAIVSDGINTFIAGSGNDSVDLTVWNLETLTITPPENSNEDMSLSFNATATEADGSQTTTSDNFLVDVVGVADAPDVDTNIAHGDAGAEIPLDISFAASQDTDGSESLSASLGGIPDGVVLSDGVNTFTGGEDGMNSVDVSDWDMDNLTVTTPAGDDQLDFALTLTATTTEDDGDTATSSESFIIDLSGDADAPTIDVQTVPVRGDEDTAISFNFDAQLTDASETLGLSIGNIPEGAILSDGVNTFLGDGTSSTVDITSWDLDSLTITPSPDSNEDFDLVVNATSTDEASGDTAYTDTSFTVEVVGVADEPSISVKDVVGQEDSAIALDIGSSLNDLDGSESIEFTLSGIPDGAIISDGTNTFVGSAGMDAADISGWNLFNLTITPPSGDSSDFDLNFTSTAIEDDGDTASISQEFNVEVTGIADDPIVEVNDVTGLEDSAIDLDIFAGLQDPSGAEVLQATLSDIPEGAILSDADGNTFTSGGDGNDSIDISNWDMDSITVTPPSDSNDDFSLTINANSVDDGDVSNIISESFDVNVTGVADIPNVSANDSDVVINNAVVLDIASSLNDTDGSETLTTTLGGLPEGSIIIDGTNWFIAGAGENSVDITGWDLDSIVLIPPGNSYEDFDLTLTSTAVELDGDVATNTTSFNINVTNIASDPILEIAQNQSGAEDSPIDLDLSASLTGVGEELTMSLSNIPDGALLTDGTNVFVASEGAEFIDISDWDLDNLSITAPADSDEDMSLVFSATSTEEEGGTATTSQEFNVDVTAVADDPVVTVSDALGDANTPIDLDLTAGLTDIDGSESLSVTISGVPVGAELSNGIDNGDGTWTLDQTDLADLTITPPQDFEGNIEMTLSATSTEADGGDTANASQTFNVEIINAADDPVVNVQDVSGFEDNAIALNVSASLSDADETLSVDLGGIPEGAILSDGSHTFVSGADNSSIDVSNWDLSTLTITPPSDDDSDFQLTLNATSTTAGGSTASVSEAFIVDVEAVADAPTVSVSDVSGSEDSAIALNLGASLTDVDQSESLSMELSGIPEGAVLSDGTNSFIAGADNSSLDLSNWNLNSLTITPAEDNSDDMNLSFSATSTEADGGDTETTTADFNVTVTGVADTPEVAVTDATGAEDTPIALNISPSITDLDGSESISAITISGVPDGAELSAGTENPDGSWTLEPGDLSGLTITPAENDGSDFTLSITATSSEEGTTATSTVGSLNVTVSDVADQPTLSVSDVVSGDEDGSIALDISSGLVDTDGSESLSITISGVPEGASLNHGTDNGNGTWTLDQADLEGLSISPAADSDEDFNLTVTSTATEADGGDSVTNTATIAVNVDAVADAPNLSAGPASGNEDEPIALDISTSVSDVDGSESIASITISDIPEGATLSAGTLNQDGSYTLTPAELQGLTITPPENSSEDFNLTITSTSIEDENGDTATSTTSLAVTVDDVAGDPGLQTGDVTGNEDTTFDLDIGVNLENGDELTSLTISHIPDGTIISDGVNTFTSGGPSGSVDVHEWDLGSLTVTPPPNSDEDFDLKVQAKVQDGESTNTQNQWFEVNVDPIADEPVVVAQDATGSEDNPIDLNLASSLADTDGSESLSTSLGGIPDGAILTDGAGHSFVAGGGTNSVDITDWDMSSISVTPPPNSDDDFQLTLSGTSTEADGGETATTSDIFNIDVTGVADEPTVSVADVTGAEDSPIALNITAGLTDTDGSETLSVTINGVPDGAVLSAGQQNEDGSWTLTGAELSGLTLTPPLDSSEDFTLSVTALSTEEDGDTALTESSFDVNVTGVADTPTLDIGPVEATEDSWVFLDIKGEATDSDGSETLTYTISNVPEGTQFSPGGVNNGDGTWTFSEHDGEVLSIKPPANSDEDFSLSVTATATEPDGSTSSVTSSLDVNIAAVADAPDASAGDVSGIEGATIALDLSSGLTDTDGSEALSGSLGGIPDGVTISDADGNSFTAGNGNNSVDISNWDLGSISLTPPEGSSDDFGLTFTATSTEIDGGDTSSVTQSFNVDIQGVAGDPVIDVSNVTGDEDSQISFDLSATAPEGDDISSISIGGFPEGSILTDGTNTFQASAGSMDVDITDWDLSNLTVQPPADSNADFDLTVNATSIDEGSSSTSSASFNVDVVGVADDPSISVNNVSGNEDSAIALDLGASLNDADTSEALSMSLSGIPDGAILTDGTNTFVGTAGSDSVNLSSWDLDSITIQAPENSDADMGLNFSATSTENDGDTATASQSFNVEVTGVADDPVVSINDAQGFEDTAIALDVGAVLGDTDGSESLTASIGDIPDGVTISDGVNSFTAGDGDNSIDISNWDMDSLTAAPPANSNVDFDLSFSATATEADGSTSTISESLNVDVVGVADEPFLEASLGEPVFHEGEGNGQGKHTGAGGQGGKGKGHGDEGTLEYGIDINTNLTDQDGSEELSVVIVGLPDTAVLSAGTQNNDGSWNVPLDAIEGLSVTVPEDQGDFSFQVQSTATENDGDTSIVSATLSAGDFDGADDPNLEAGDVTGNEDSPIELDISASLSDPEGETLTVTIDGVPDGAILSAGVNNEDGSWTLGPDDLSGLTITPPADSSEDFNLTVTAISEENGDTASVSETFNVDVTGVADEPMVSVSDVSGLEDQPIALDISAGLTDTDGSETLSVTINGVPDGAVLSAGQQNEDGSWTLTGEELGGLTLTPAQDSSEDFTLSVTALSTDTDGDTAMTESSFDVNVTGVADTPTLDIGPVEATEDSWVFLDIKGEATDSDGSETLTYTISDVPEGTQFSPGGVNNGDGTWTFSEHDGEVLCIKPPANSDEDFSLSVTAIATESDGSTSSVTSSLDVNVAAVADAPDTSAGNVSGIEGEAIALDISSTLTDTDGSEVLSGSLGGIPDGAILTDGDGNSFTAGAGENSVDISDWDLGSLSITPPEGSSDDFGLTFTATSIELDDGDSTSVTQSFNVDIDGVAGVPVINVSNVSGDEDSAIQFDLSATAPEGDDISSISIGGFPEGSIISDGVNTFQASVGSTDFNITDWNLSNLSVTPPANSNEDFDLTVNATSVDEGSSSSSSASFTVDVVGVADEPNISVNNFSGNEDSAIALNLGASLTDGDGSEALSMSLSGIPDGAFLTDGTNSFTATSGADSVDLSGWDLNSITIQAPENSDADMSLSFSAVSTEDDGDTSSVSQSFNVEVTGVADNPIVSVEDSVGAEDSSIALDVGAVLGDTDGSESLTASIGDIPDGVMISDGVNSFTAGDGVNSIDISNWDMDALSATPPEDSNVDFDLSFNATATELDGSTSTISENLNVDVIGVADEPFLEASLGEPIFHEGEGNGNGKHTGAGGQGGKGKGHNDDGTVEYAINIETNLTDTDGSEALSVTIIGLPADAELSAGSQNNDGSWSIPLDDIEGLSVTVPEDQGNFSFQVNAVSTENDGDQAIVSQTLSSEGFDGADDPNLSAGDVSGAEDSAIDLDLSASLSDPEGETLSTSIEGIPDGAIISDGDHSFTAGAGENSVDTSDWDLGAISITPPANSSDDFSLIVTATSAENGDTASVTETFNVDVVGVADVPTVSVSNVSGAEDSAIALDISAGLSDLDGSESLSITIDGVPDGATLSAGQQNDDGSWSLNSSELSGLTLTPPQDSSADFSLNVQVLSTEADGGTAMAESSFDVNVTGVADTPTLDIGPVEATEDTWVFLDIKGDASDSDGSETLTYTITDVPEGTQFSPRGVDNGDGTWSFSEHDGEVLCIKPPADSDEDFALSVTATATEADGSTSSVESSLMVNVEAVADEPVLNASIGEPTYSEEANLSVTVDAISEGAGYHNSYGVYTLDDDGNPSVGEVVWNNVDDNLGDSATIEFGDVSQGNVGFFLIPDGADHNDLENGTAVTFSPNDDGGWEIIGPDGEELGSASNQNLFSHDNLNADGGDYDADNTASGNQNWEDLYGGGDNDFNDFNANAVFEQSGGDTALAIYPIDIDTNLTDVDGSESLAVVLDNLPEGAELSAGEQLDDGSWSVPVDQLEGLTLSVPADTGAFDFNVNAISTEAVGGDQAIVSSELSAGGVGEANDPILEAGDVAGFEDQAIDLDISASLSDPDGETLTTIIEDVPAGAIITDGENAFQATDDISGIDVSDWDMSSMQVIPPENSSEDLELSVSAISMENGTTAEVNETFSVDITGVADGPIVSVSDVSGSEDSVIDLDIAVGLSDLDGSEALSASLAGIPDGAVLSDGINSFEAAGGENSVDISDWDISSLNITPPENNSEDFSLSLTTTATEVDGDSISVANNFLIDISPVADQPILEVMDVVGNEDTAIDLNFNVGLADTDGSEVLDHVFINGVPEGALLSDGVNTFTGTSHSGSINVAEWNMDDITITPPPNSDEDFHLNIAATSTETENGNCVTNSQNMAVGVHGIADEPSFLITSTPLVAEVIADDNDNRGHGNNDDFDDADNPGNAPWADDQGKDKDEKGKGKDKGKGKGDDNEDNFFAGAGKGKGDDDDGRGKGKGDDDDNGKGHGKGHGKGDEGDGEETSNESIFALDIEFELTDTDGSEELGNVVIGGLPEGASLNNGTPNGDGTWTLNETDMDGLQLTAPEGQENDFSITIQTATFEIEGDSHADVSIEFPIDIDETSTMSSGESEGLDGLMVTNFDFFGDQLGSVEEEGNSLDEAPPESDSNAGNADVIELAENDRSDDEDIEDTPEVDDEPDFDDGNDGDTGGLDNAG